MDEHIQRSLDYLEEHLKAEISPADLAAQAGYSPWHFSRLFARETGQPVAQYMLRRRLDRALGEIAAGSRAIDTVLSYGFETYSGFYRAFVRLYGCSPRKYLRLYGGAVTTKTEAVMKHYTKRELKQVLGRWGMEKAEIGEVPVMYDGRPDETEWAVDGSCVLRTGDRVRLLKNLQVTTALAAHGFKAEVPVPTADGEDFAEADGVFVLSRVMPGSPLKPTACYGEHSPARAVGEGIARLHDALRDVAAEVPHDRGDLLGSLLEWALPAVRLQDEQWSLGLGEAFFAGWRERFEALYPQLPRQLIHRNPCPSYVLMAEGEVTGFRQFDMLEDEVRLFDLCYAATGILSETTEEALCPAWLTVLEELVRGYDGASPLTEAERQALPDMLCAIQMISVAYFGEHEIDRELARRNRDMLRFIAARREEIAAIAL
ncbi:MAG: helix-turn-helix domain-containing protein [Christensenellaceae bacterium]|nr:helix-turn-helix domain-containing protein [Christensenellaceae bacterium]